jgi:RNA polymerase sigma-70 factor (ECF subfamily)
MPTLDRRIFDSACNRLSRVDTEAPPLSPPATEVGLVSVSSSPGGNSSGAAGHLLVVDNHDPCADDRRRFEDLYRQHYGELLRYVARQLEFDAARDVVAETMLVAWRRRAERPTNARAWLFGVARNLLLNANRSSARQDRLAVRVRPTGAEPVPDPAEAVVDTALVRALLERLDPLDREALELIEWDGLTPVEAAGVTGSSRSAFRVRLHRARRRLRALYVEQLDAEASPRLIGSTQKAELT